MDDVLIKVGADISDLSSGLSKASRDITSFGTTSTSSLTGAAKAAGVYVDANGRMREANGKFVSDARKAELGISAVSKETKTLSTRLKDSSSDIKGMGLALTGFGTGLALALGGAVKTATDFDTALRKAGAIAGATDEEFNALKKSAIELGANTSKSASEVAVAMTEMAAKGFDATKIIAAMPGVISAAEASGEDLALTADTVSSALNIWGLEAGEAGRVADVLAMSANVSAAGIDSLSYSLKYAGAPAAALGISLEEVAAAAGIMADAGLDGSSAGTSLRASLLALNNPAKAQQKIMDELGFSILDSSGNAKSLADIVGDLGKSLEGETDAQKVATLAKLVGTEAVSGFLALMDAGPDSINKTTAALKNSAGESKKTADQMKAGLGGALEELSGAFESAAIYIGDALTPAIQQVAEFVTDLVNKFNEAPPAFQQFIAVGAAVTAGLALIAGPLLLIIGFLPQIAAGFTALGTVAAALTSPITLVVAAIAAFIAGLIYAYNEIEEFKAVVDEIFNVIAADIEAAFEAISEIFKQAMDWVKSFIKDRLDQLRDFWRDNGEEIKNSVLSLYTKIRDYIVEAFNGIVSFIKPQLEKIR